MFLSLPIAIKIVLYSFAVFRATLLFCFENGPGDVFDWIRFKAGLMWFPQKDMFGSRGKFDFPAGTKPTFLGKLLKCPYCLSGWLSLIAVGALSINNVFIDLAALWLGLWGVVHLAIVIAERT